MEFRLNYMEDLKWKILSFFIFLIFIFVRNFSWFVEDCVCRNFAVWMMGYVGFIGMYASAVFVNICLGHVFWFARCTGASLIMFLFYIS